MPQRLQVSSSFSVSFSSSLSPSFPLFPPLSHSLTLLPPLPPSHPLSPPPPLSLTLSPSFPFSHPPSPSPSLSPSHLPSLSLISLQLPTLVDPSTRLVVWQASFSTTLSKSEVNLLTASSDCLVTPQVHVMVRQELVSQLVNRILTNASTYAGHYIGM